LFFRRKRPSGQRGQLYFSFDHHSFPSGHAARVAALAIVLGSAYPAFALPLAVWALLVALSRVALGVHYLFDVIVGIAAGVVIGDVLRWFL
jgi:undecaprenyl-diphosphatase